MIHLSKLRYSGRRRAIGSYPAILVSLFLTVVLAAGPVAAAKAGAETGLPIPRFVSLRADKANLRAGPGLRYPIEWVYKRQKLPLLILDEFEAWRKIRASDGTTGWMHSVMLSGARTLRVTGPGPRVLREDPASTAAPVARLAPGVIGELEDCEPAFCYIDAGRVEGWLRRDSFFGALPREGTE